MRITKKVRCLHCSTIVEGDASCTCGKIMIKENTVVVGAMGTDYVDVSPKLLNE